MIAADNSKDMLKSVDLRLAAFALCLVPAIGESSKVISGNPIGVPIVLYIAGIATGVVFRRMLPRGKLFWITLVLATVSTVKGISKNATYFLFQDLLPIVVALSTYSLMLAFSKQSVVKVVRRIGNLFLALAVLKLLLIATLRPEQDWSGSWVAATYSFDTFIPRIMLKGVPPVLFLLICSHLMCYARREGCSFVTIAVALLVLIIDGSRALIVATLLTILTSVLASETEKNVRNRVFKGAIIIPLSLLTIVFVSSKLRSEDVQPTGDLALIETQSTSLSYRVLESLVAVNSLESIAFGNGLGSSFKMIASGAGRDDGEGNFVHSLPIWILLKGGAISLLVFVFAVGTLSVSFLRNVFSGQRFSHAASMQRVARASLIFFIAGSSVTNMAATFSGGIALGTLAALSGVGE